MPGPRATTIKTYQDRYAAYAERAAPEVSGDFKEWMDAFASHLPAGGSILEFGSATGRDARYFSSLGFKVTCTDIVPEAVAALAEAGFAARYHDFHDDPLPEWTESFDGFFANAVLLHAEPAAFEKAFADIAHILKPGGAAAFSVKAGEGEEMSLEKMDAPRYFRYYTAQTLSEILSRQPFTISSLALSPDEKWLRVIMLRQGPANTQI